MEISYLEAFKSAVVRTKFRWLCAALRKLGIEEVNNLVAIVEGVPDVP